jgi:hypothetical protein
VEPELDDDSEELDSDELDSEEDDSEELDSEDEDSDELDSDEEDSDELESDELDDPEQERTRTSRFHASQVQARLASQAPGRGMSVMLPAASNWGWTAPYGLPIPVISLAGLWVRFWSSKGLRVVVLAQLPVWSKVKVSFCWRVASTTPL